MARKTTVDAVTIDVPVSNEPQLRFTERVGYQLSAAMDEENGFLRGWETANDPEVQAHIAERNARERARCKAAVLAMLRK